MDAATAPAVVAAVLAGRAPYIPALWTPASDPTRAGIAAS